MSVPRPTGGGASGVPIDFLNGSILQAGDPSYGSLGAGGGIEQVCSIDYRQRWEGGRLWFFDQSGMGVREVRMNFGAPSVNDDDRDSMRFRVGSRWVHQDGREWECSDATEGAAVWNLITVGGGSLTNVIHFALDGNNTTGDGSAGNPYATAQKAYDIGKPLASGGTKVCLMAGPGSFPSGISGDQWNDNMSISGHITSSIPSIICSGVALYVLQSDLNIHLGSVYLYGPTGNSVVARNVRAFNIAAINSDYGSTGATGTPGDDVTPGGQGGDGGTGPSGHPLVALNCIVSSNIYSAGGYGGAGGEGGSDGGAGAGASGNTGASGEPGPVTCHHCRVEYMTGNPVSYAGTIVNSINSTPNTANDLGGNAVGVPFI